MAIKKLKIKNFESHKDTTFDFVPGLNCIHGKSNNGKSSALRAIELAAYGVWAAGENKKKGINGPVRIGASFAEIYVESDSGYVKTKRAKGTNEWEIKEFSTGEVSNFKNPGSGPISLAQEVLGLETMKVADQSIRFNWSDQRDKHFLIDEVEGKNSSPSFVAAVLDEVGGLSGCEDLIRSLASDKSKLEQKMKKAGEEASATEEELEKFKNLDDKIKKADIIEGYILEAEEKTDQANKAKRLKLKIYDLQTKIQDYSDLDSQIANREKAESLLKKAESKYFEFTKASKISKSIDGMIGDLSIAKERVAELNKIDIVEIQNDCIKIKDLFDTAKDCKKIYSKIRRKKGALERIPKEKINFRSVGSMLNNANSKISDLENIQIVINNLRAKEKVLKNKEIEFSKTNRIFENSKEELKDFLDSMGNICPLCNQEMSDKCKEEIMIGV